MVRNDCSNNGQLTQKRAIMREHLIHFGGFIWARGESPEKAALLAAQELHKHLRGLPKIADFHVKLEPDQDDAGYRGCLASIVTPTGIVEEVVPAVR